MTIASPNLTLTAVLFAGGESRRMGADKATLLVNGEPLWSRQLNLLRELGPETILISARSKPGWLPCDIELVLDDPPSRGPLSGLVAALKKTKTTHLLAMAIDLPRMTSRHLRELCSEMCAGCGVIPINDDFLEPLCAIYPVTEPVVAAMTTALASNDASLQSVARGLLCQAKLGRVPIGAASRRFYFNANTPGDILAATR